MLNENNPKLIKYYKSIIIAIFWILIAVALFLTIDNWFIGEVLDFCIGESYFLGSIVLFFGISIPAFFQLVVNLLIIRFFNDVKTIREKIEKL